VFLAEGLDGKWAVSGMCDWGLVKTVRARRDEVGLYIRWQVKVGRAEPPTSYSGG
jgi:hypothetical protein